MPPLIMAKKRQQGMTKRLTEETPRIVTVIMLKLSFPVRQLRQKKWTTTRTVQMTMS